ncbi:MAG TPA: TlpA disulfide reductase family protein [Candidatus Polarisedimenticolia bacterium]|nr:TlpA disulfide reductase family protein [Candidatus Polarisedimenticolia bacterium]
MRLRLRVLVLALLAAVSLGARRPAEPPELKETLARLEKTISSATAAETEPTLADLMAQHPDSPDVYRLYVRVLKLQKKTPELRESARTTLARLEGVPSKKRTEDQLAIMLRACSVLDDKDRRDRFEQELIDRYPKGRHAGWKRMRQASEEKDPVRAAALYEGILKDYSSDNTLAPWLTNDRMRLIEANPERFTARQLHDAAWAYEGMARRAWKAGTQAGAYWYIVAAKEAAEALAKQWPEESLEMAGRGMACLEKSWPTEEMLRAELPVMFWPGMLEAHAAAGRLEPARKIGEAIVAHLEADDLSEDQAGWLEEARSRSGYSSVLEKLGAVQEARMQLGLAAEADDARRKDLEAFQQRHPLEPADAEAFQKDLSASRAAILGGRKEQAKRRLLAGLVDEPMHDFVAEDLQGNKVNLASFHGKTVVMTLWATWCGSCHWEMNLLEQTRQRYEKDPKVTFAAMSIDWEREKVAPFVRDKKVNLPVFIAGDSFEKDFGVESVPQMFIIDASGRMRFRLVDILPDDRFQQSLDWMIEAAGK